MKYVTIFWDLTPGSCPRGWGLGVTGVKTEGFFFPTQNLILVNSWWNVLPSFNFALGGKRGDLRLHAFFFITFFFLISLPYSYK